MSISIVNCVINTPDGIRMESLKLKLGNFYWTRDGTERVKIVRKAQKTDVVYRKTHPFVDTEGYAYMPDGRTHSTKEYPFDLVRSVSANKK